MPRYDHCLRPIYTERIIHLLQHSKSLNLIGAETAGVRRLLEDIRECRLPAVAAVIVNLKNYYASYNGLVNDLWRQFGHDGEQPATFEALLERYEHHRPQIFLLLHNFDALLDNSRCDPLYTIAFYDTLNNLRHHPSYSLLCVTKKPHDHSFVFIDEKPYRSSWLDLEHVSLPALKHEEIIYEVKRRKLPLSRKNRNLLIQQVRRHPAPYHLLEFFTNKILDHEDKTLPFPDRVKRWEKEFQRSQHRIKSTFVITLIGQLEGWIRFLRLDTKRVNFLWKAGLALLVFLLSVIGVEKSGLGQRLLEFVQQLLR